MQRLKYLFVVGALAVVVGVVAADPAVAAKGGNSDNAHACQQGGHQNRFEAETGKPFKNAGDCVSYGAQGSLPSVLVLNPSPTYGCGTGTCWGTLLAKNLQAKAPWTVVDAFTQRQLASGFADTAGEVDAVLLNLPCDVDEVDVSSITSAGGLIRRNGVVAPC
jgi:hypothetical protein